MICSDTGAVTSTLRPVAHLNSFKTFSQFRLSGRRSATAIGLLLVSSACSDDANPVPTSDASVDAGPSVHEAGVQSSAPVPDAAPSSSSVSSVVDASATASVPETDAQVPTEPVEASMPDAQTSSSPEASTPAVSSEPDAQSVPSAAPSSDASVTDGGTDASVVPQLPAECVALPAPPVAFEEIPGFTSSEDFVFDELGNYVGVENGNLVRITKAGDRQLWAPSMGSTAGMGILPDGSVVINDVGEGALKRVYPNGYIQVLVGGLLYPNGLDVGPDGFVYVAENNAGRVRRIDPDTGDYTIVALGLHGSNGVAFGNDPTIMYVGSFEGSGVYKVVMSTPGALGHSTVLARPNGSTLPEPDLRCPDQQVGVSCVSNTQAGKCAPLANVVDCFPADPCPDLQDGDSCDFPQQGGICSEGSCVGPCSGHNAWDECETGYGSGVCAPTDNGLQCRGPQPCDELDAGDQCVPAYGAATGVCVEGGYFGLDCKPTPCAGLNEGDACDNGYGEPGTCAVSKYGDELDCRIPQPCDGLSAGDDCDYYDSAGTCVDDGWGYLSCYVPPPCEGKVVGDACDAGWAEGVCTDFGWGGYLSCNVPPACEGRVEGDACDGYGFDGVCLPVTWSEDLTCQELTCDGLVEGDACSTNYTVGTCAVGGVGLYCKPAHPCDGLNEGDSCEPSGYYSSVSGVCTLDSQQQLQCRLPQPCDGLSAGDVCDLKSDGPVIGPVGVYDSGSGEVSVPIPPSYPGSSGICVENGEGLECVIPQPCDGLAAGDACEDYYGTGVCTEQQYGGGLSCQRPSSCEGLEDGTSCASGYNIGTCTDGICVEPPSPGGIDGMAVDACGNVYASEYIRGNVWRISPEGEIELITKLPSHWIPNIKFGRDIGGFQRNIMYVADRDEGRLFGIEIGVAGATEYYDLAAAQ